MPRPIVNAEFADRVNSRMQELNISRTVLAKRSGVTACQIGYICTGRIKMTSALNAVKLADALHCDLRWLITGEETKKFKI